MVNMDLQDVADRSTHLEDVAFLNLVTWLVALQHFFEYSSLLLNLANLLGSLCTIVGLATSVKAGHDLHELVGFLQIMRGTPADEFLQLC
jgi:hypothetical protein